VSPVRGILKAKQQSRKNRFGTSGLFLSLLIFFLILSVLYFPLQKGALLLFAQQL